MSDMEYKKYKLKELLTIKNGKDHKKLAEGDYPVYGSGGYMRSVNSFLYDRKSILLPRKGTLSNIQYVSGTPFWTVDTIYYTVLNENLYNPYYLYLYLNTLNLSGYDSGASIPSMTSKTYYSLNIELPEKKIQTKIANVIRAYDNLIENNNKRIKLLEQMAESLYKEWFVRFHFPGYEDVEFESGIPKGWKVCRIDQLSKIKAGGDAPDDSTKEITDECSIPIYSNGIENEGLYGYTSKAKINKPSISISARGTVGYTCLRRVSYTPIVRLICIIPHEENLANWLFYYFKRTIVIANGTSQQQITIPMMSREKVLLPTNDLIQKFYEYSTCYLDKIDSLKAQNSNLEKQRDMLLPRLMSGKLEA